MVMVGVRVVGLRSVLGRGSGWGQGQDEADESGAWPS